MVEDKDVGSRAKGNHQTVVNQANTTTATNNAKELQNQVVQPTELNNDVGRIVQETRRNNDIGVQSP